MRFVLASALLLLTSCSTMNELEPYKDYSAPPTLAVETKTEKILGALPPPSRPITVSVYEFRDNTGQAKPADTPQSSRAVTQGGLDLLKKALIDAGNQSWFRVLERGGLEHLLQERKIIRSIRSSYATPSGERLPPLGPLLYSGMLLEGSIVAYESNVLTGGLGARYLGIGGSTQYQRDIVTVALSAVSVTSGEVIAAVNTSKTIFSTGVSAGIFKYVSFDKIVESEAGFTVNEPPQLAVRQAIEMAVYALIMKGFEKKLWSFADPMAGQMAYEEFRYRSQGEEIPDDLQEQVAAKLRTAALKQRPSRSMIRPAVVSGPAQAAHQRPLPRSQAAALAKPHQGEAPQQQRQLSQKKRQQAAKSQERAAESVFSRAVTQAPRGWYIQVAAVQDGEPEGARIAGALTQGGFPLVVQKTSFESVQYLRVLVGPYDTKESALLRQEPVRRISSQHGRPSYGKPFLKRVY